MLALHIAFACPICAMQRLSHATEEQCQCKQLDHVIASLQQVSQKTTKSQHAHDDYRQDHEVSIENLTCMSMPN